MIEPELRTPRNSRHASRWKQLTKDGIRATSGERVTLAFTKLPHGPHTNRAAIRDFVRRLNGIE